MASLVHTSLQQVSPCAAGSMEFNDGVDERDFDYLSEVIPETQGMGGITPIESALKKFSPPKNEISKSALAEGFSWQPKRPTRPGQFSERPKQKASTPPLVPLPNFHEGSSSKGTQAGPKAPPPRPKHDGVQRPLELPELNFEKTPEPLSVLRKAVGDSVTSPKEAFPPQNMQGKRESSHHTTDTTSSSSFSGHQSLFDSSQVQSTHLGNTTEIKRTSCPFPNLTSLPPSYASKLGKAGRANSTTASPLEKIKVISQGKLHEQRAIPRSSDRRHSDQLPSHIRYMAQELRHNSPASTCGDLEGPVHQTPRRSLRPHGRDLESTTFHRWETRRQQGCSRNSTQRSQSRASYISRKRAGVHKPYHGGDTGRKKALMEQVALHWNECLQLAEEEKQGAVREIRRLQDDVAQKSKELDASQTMVSHHQRQVQEIEERCKKIEEQQSVVSQHNEQLSGEVETLRKELCDSKGKAAQLGEKYKTYKDKINDAIGEQQDLYKRSQAYYQHLFQELEQERTKKNDKVGEIDEALRVSQEKRSEMKKVFEEFRVQIGEESRKSKLQPLRFGHF